MGLKTLIRDLAQERGLKIDEDELEQLGLSDDDETGAVDEAVTDTGSDASIFSTEIPGTAAGAIELFSNDTFSGVELSEKDGLMWAPIIREGQWAVRPGATGKKRVPLKIVAGKSANQRREIGLSDLKDAFDDEAIQHVTVPSSHNNSVLENQGFIKAMKIVKGTVKDLKTKKDKAVSVLMGGYDITEPDTKGKMSRGTIANRSAGILYDYVNTETGKKYPAAIEHVALTNKPWITGMISFGRKMSATPKLQTVGLSLSNEAPSDDDYALALSDELDLADGEGDFLAQESTDWSKEASPSWLREQVNRVLSEARSKKMAAKRVANAGSVTLYDDYPPNYRCCEAKPGTALISDGYGENANHWSAPITVTDGALELADFTKWSALKKAFIPDERPAPDKDALPLSQERPESKASMSALQLAQNARRNRVRSGSPENKDTREVVGNMAGTETLDLSEEAQRLIQAAEARAAAAEEKATQLSETVSKLVGTVNGNEVDSYISKLKASPSDGGLGLSEEKGFGGVLVEIRQLMLADDGQPALASDHFSTDSNKDGALTLSEAIKRIFSAFEKVQEGKASVGDQLSQSSEASAAADEGGTKASTDAAAAATNDGKPAAGDAENETHLSAKDKVIAMAKENPQMAALVGGLGALKIGSDA